MQHVAIQIITVVLSIAALYGLVRIARHNDSTLNIFIVPPILWCVEMIAFYAIVFLGDAGIISGSLAHDISPIIRMSFAISVVFATAIHKKYANNGR